MSEYIEKSKALGIVDKYICHVCLEKPNERRDTYGCRGCHADDVIRAIEYAQTATLLTEEEAKDKYLQRREAQTAGDRLYNALKENKISQRECAQKIGYTGAYLSHIIHGRREMTRDVAEAIEAAFPQIRASYLIGFTGREMQVMLDDGAYMPERAYEWDAGMDIRSPVSVTVPSKGSVTISTGVHIAIPQGYVGLLKSKSGLNVKHGIQSEGTIDAGYTGAIAVKLYNHSDTAYEVESGDKISQLVIVPCLLRDVIQVDELPETDRGAAGFGSTGR